MQPIKNTYIQGKDSLGEYEIQAANVNYSRHGGINTVANGVSARSYFTTEDFLYQRPEYDFGKDFSKIINMCRKTYFSTSIVRQVIDLQVDFVVDGFDLEHKQIEVERFFKAFLEKTKFKDAASEFTKHLLLEQNTIVRRVTANLTKAAQERWIEIAAKADVKIKRANRKNHYNKTEIPVRYVFIDPAVTFWKKGDALGILPSSGLFYKIDRATVTKIRKGITDGSILTNNLPSEFRSQLNSPSFGNKDVEVPLDMEKTYVAHLKKDSWDDWAVPSLYSVFSDILLKQKLKQADAAAIDGIIKPIRLWKLGDHNKEIYPSPGAFTKLQTILESNTGGGSLDVIWDSMIEMEEFYPPVENILGPEKYAQVDKDILIGLGVPEVLLGGDGSNFSNSFIQLKTLVEKLKDVRDILLDWINKELSIICKSLDIQERPIVKFSNMIMHDENVYRQLLIQLSDRNLISNRTLLQKFDENIDIELERTKKETKDYEGISDDETKIKKVGPFSAHTYKGEEEPTSGPISVGGRPPNTKDVGRRNRASTIRARDLSKIQNKVDAVHEEVTKNFIGRKGLANARKMSKEDREELDSTIVSVLSCINNIDSVDKNWINETLNSHNPNNEFIEEFNSELSSFENPTIADRKNIQTLILTKGI